MTRIKIIALTMSFLFLFGCASDPYPMPVATAIEEAVSQIESTQPAITSEVDEHLLAGADFTEPQEDRFDIDVVSVNAKEFFSSLVAGTGLNIVVHPNVKGAISLSLQAVTVDEVLRVIRDIYGYEYRLSNSIYTIFPREMQTQIFTIDYLDVERRGVSDTSVVVSKIESNQTKNSNSNGIASQQNERQTEVSGTRVNTRTHNDFWKSLQHSIRSIIGLSDALPGDIGNVASGGMGRNVMTNPQAGMVVVKALPKELAMVREFLERSQLSIQRQVILETKILEVQLNDNYSAGINWNAISGQLMAARNTSEFGQNFTITTASEAVGEVVSSVVGVNDISTLLSLLETQGSVQVLSSPRVSTVNNQKAIIRVGSDEFFVTGVSSSSTSNASSTTSTPNLELSSFFSGIALDVTPQIAEDGSVILHVHPVVSSVTDQTKNITVGGQQFSLPLAFREVRESDSIVRAHNGQVVVLGGLMKETLIDSNGKRPVIGDIPLVNSLFKTKDYKRTKAELVILMKPIVVDGESWANQLNGTRSRVRALGGEIENMR